MGNTEILAGIFKQNENMQPMPSRETSNYHVSRTRTSPEKKKRTHNKMPT